MRGKASILLAGMVIALFANTPLHSAVFDTQKIPRDEDNFFEARTRLWVPDDAGKLGGILVLLQGTDSDARSAVAQAEWQEFARRHRLALVGCYFRGDGEPYEDASRGSGEALLEMLAELIGKSGHPELNKAPLLFVGHSAGAMFSYNFACWKPEVVLSFVSLKSGPISPTENRQAWNVPGLFIVGDSDLSGRVRSTAEAFSEASGKNGSHWALALEPGGGHGSSAAIRSLLQDYLAGVLSISTVGETKSSPRVPVSAGVIRRLENPSTAHMADTTAADLVWLPTESVARSWEKFVRPIKLSEIIKSGGVEESARPEKRAVSLDFGEVDFRKDVATLEKTFDVTVKDLSDVSFAAADGTLRVGRVKKISDGHYRLALSIDKEKARPGYYRTVVNASSKSGVKTSIPVTARVLTGYAAKPSSLYVGVIARGEVCELPIEIVSDTGRLLKVASIRSSQPEFAAARETGTGKLLCRFDGANGLGNQSGQFEVVLEENPQRQLKIPFIAWVAKKKAL